MRRWRRPLVKIGWTLAAVGMAASVVIFMWLVVTASDDQNFNRLVGFSNIFAFVVGVLGLLLAALGTQKSKTESPSEAALANILRNQIRYYEDADWTRHAIPLLVREEALAQRMRQRR